MSLRVLEGTLVVDGQRIRGLIRLTTCRLIPRLISRLIPRSMWPWAMSLKAFSRLWNWRIESCLHGKLERVSSAIVILLVTAVPSAVIIVGMSVRWIG